MKINKAEFLKSCPNPSDFPKYKYPEYAFFGRSNVGKSSLINMILGRKNLVKTGANPGVTRTVNFFIVNDKISFADLPGYGYAKLPKEVKKKFLPLINGYIKNRENLKLAFLLIDIRRIPDEFEFEILSTLTKKKIPVVITVTKSDKISKNQRNKYLMKISEALEIEESALFLTSSKSGEGKFDILKLISEYRTL